jgi:DNA-binding protein H-NS
MPRQNLASMSVEALLKLKDEVSAALGRKATSLKQELARLGDDAVDIVHIARYGRKSLKNRKVPPKYRDRKSGATWAGRGAQPVWLRDALKGGAKIDDFLIEKSKAAPKKSARKTRRKRKAA